jgi:hypothetical protein
MAASVHQKIDSKRKSFFAIVVLILHGIVILIFANLKHIQPSSLNSSLQMIQLKPEVVESVLVIEPSFDFHPQINYPAIPGIEFDRVNQTDIELIHALSDKPYELLDKNNTRYKNVFDPKLRQKLIDAQGFNAPRIVEKPSSWTEADGRTFVDTGNGNCLVSMFKADSRDRDTNWGHTRCGKSDSEGMMDDVMADFEARRNPLGSK